MMYSYALSITVFFISNCKERVYMNHTLDLTIAFKQLSAHGLWKFEIKIPPGADTSSQDLNMPLLVALPRGWNWSRRCRQVRLLKSLCNCKYLKLNQNNFHMTTQFHLNTWSILWRKWKEISWPFEQNPVDENNGPDCMCFKERSKVKMGNRRPSVQIPFFFFFFFPFFLVLGILNLLHLSSSNSMPRKQPLTTFIYGLNIG